VNRSAKLSASAANSGLRDATAPAVSSPKRRRRARRRNASPSSGLPSCHCSNARRGDSPERSNAASLRSSAARTGKSANGDGRWPIRAARLPRAPGGR
jgi:hypothetical protein